MKMIYCSLITILVINTLKAQQSSNLNVNFLSEKTLIANLNYSILPTTINTDKSNIALGTFKDKFVISSYKKYPHTSVDVNRYTKEKVPNILCTEVSYDYDLKYPSLFSHLLKSEYNEGAITFNAAFNEAFLTRKKDLKEKEYFLFKSTLIDSIKGVWSDPIEVLIDNKSIPLTNPKLSKNNKLMYFAAQLPNGFGGYDIYSAEYKNGTLINLKNLGAEINTEFNELAAIDEGDFIYFSSDMPGGFGGYDIYRATNKKGGYKYKINIGNKINTENDEINLIPITRSEGYFTSNKDTGVTYDIFRYKIKFENVNVKTTFVDDNDLPIADLPIDIITEDGTLIFKGITNANGNVVIDTAPFNAITYNFKSDTYYTNENLIYDISDDNPNHYNRIKLNSFVKNIAPLADKPNFRKIADDNTVFFGFDKYQVNENEIQNIINIADILKQFPELNVVVQGYADKTGKPSYNKKLSQKRINSVVSILISSGIDKNRIIMDPKGSTKPYIECNICSEEENAQNRRVHFEIFNKEE